jgi:cytochrome c
MPIRFLFILECLLASSANFAAETPKQLATRYLCFGCHTVAETRVGPSFMDVAERYGKRKDAVPYLLKELKDGSVGKWGSAPMPAEIAPDPDLQKILRWVMEQ